MTYAYQIFGVVYTTVKELNGFLDEHRSRFENMPGLISRRVFFQLEGDVASGLYICEDKETAEKIKVIVNEIVEKYEEHIGFTTEFIFKIIEKT